MSSDPGRGNARTAARSIARRILLVAIHAGLGACLTSCRGGAGVPPGGAGALEPPQGIILVTIDTLRADHLGCYGNARAETPVIDALARESILYEDATTTAPITLVAHATLLTGLTPPAHGVRTNGSFRLPASVETLAERLKSRGYATGAFIGAFVLHHEFGLDQGFDTYDDTLVRSSRKRRFEFEERRAHEVLGRAGDWALSVKGRRFFLWTHLYDPHAPYDPPPPFSARFSDRPYDGEIAYVDAEIGAFLARLKEGGLLDRSLLLVTADHGEGLGEHGERTHGLFLYQSTLHVPLIVRPPGGASPPARVQMPVGLVDVAPSILAAVGAPGAESMEGHALPGFPGWEAMKGHSLPGTGGGGGRYGTDARTVAPKTGAGIASAPSEAARAGYYFENMLPRFSFGWAGLQGYRGGRHKLIRAVRSEIYDLAADPGEVRDLAMLGAKEGGAGPGRDAGPGGAAHNRTVAGSPHAGGEPGAGLAARLDEATRSAQARAPRGAENADLSAEARQNLLALGYVSMGETPRAPSGSRESGPDPRDMLEFFDGIELAKDDLREGRSEEGIARLEKLVASGPASVGVLGLLGQARMERGEFAAALKILLRARALDPRDYEIRRRIAEGYYEQRDFEAAAREAREALRLNDRNAESRSILGAALGRLGRHEEAIASFRQAIAQRPEEPALYYNLGLALERASRRSEAEGVYAQAIERDPGASPARVSLAGLLSGRGDLPGARALLEEALRRDGRDLGALELLGVVLARMGDARGALDLFDRVVALDPDRAEAHFDRGLVLEKLDRPREAAESFRVFVSRWKGDPGRLRSAEEHLRRLGG